MKILLINHDKGWSGGQEHLKDLATELTRSGVKVQFSVRANSKSASRFAELNLPIHSFPGHGIGDLIALWRMVRLLRRERFDIVSVNREHDLTLTVLAWKLAFPFNNPGKLMMSYHTATSRKQLLLGCTDAIVCISEHVHNKLLSGNHSVKNKTSILYYGIELSAPPTVNKFDRYRERLYFKGESFPLIGMVGEFWKNQTELVTAMPIMLQAFPKLKIVFVGDNTDANLIKPLLDKISDLKLEKSIIFTGRVPRDKIPDVFFDFDLSVTTHRNEGFGIVHLESLSAGTPVVTYDEGGMVDIFKGEEVGSVVHGGSIDFANAIIDLLKNDNRRFILGKNGYELVKRKYSLAAMGKRYIEFYKRILSLHE